MTAPARWSYRACHTAGGTAQAVQVSPKVHAPGGGTTPVSRRAFAAALDWLNIVQVATSKIRSKLMCSVFAGRNNSAIWRKQSSGSSNEVSPMSGPKSRLLRR